MPWDVNIERTKEVYATSLESFISSELMTVDPLHISDEEIVSMLEKRATNKGGSLWLDKTDLFFSLCKLESVQENGIDGPHPWAQIVFQPIRNFGPVTINRFIYPNEFLSRHREATNNATGYSNKILGCTENYNNLDYFRNHIGQPYIKCYSFPTRNPFNLGSSYSCIRFATMDYKRKALLLTQAFAIYFLLNRPEECFDGLVTEDPKRRLLDYNQQKELFTPVLSSRQEEITTIKERIDNQLFAMELEAEKI